MSEEKFSKCGEGEKCECKISGVRKKRKLEEEFKKKNEVTEIFDENFQSVFRVWFVKLKLRFAGRKEVIVKITV